MPSLPVVLVACGSFNPPTKAHTWMYQVAKDHLTKAGFHVLGGYLSPVNDSYKKPSLISAQFRVEMCRLAVSDVGDLWVDEWESQQEKFINTLFVLEHLHKSHLESQPFRTMLLCGADMMLSFLKPGVWYWDHVVKILQYHGVVCIARDEENLGLHLGPHSPLFPYKDNVHLVSPPKMLNISSTMVRERIKSHLPVDDLVHTKVQDYIKTHRLYLKENEHWETKTC